jgi:hypothetical protein
MEQTERSETLVLKLQKPRNNPEGSIGHSDHGESLKYASCHLDQKLMEECKY